MTEINQSPATKITFLGTSTAVPDLGSDTASLLINDRILVDTGWKSAENLRRMQVEPTSLEHVIFTHFHQDHYVSLPSLLFYIIMRKKDLTGLKIVGPAQDLELTVERTLEFLKQGSNILVSGKPQLIPLAPGDEYETDSFMLHTHETVHPVPGLSYRFTDKNNGVVFAFCGDTAYHPPLAQFVKGSKLLIHEVSLGPGAADPDNNPSLHSGAQDAARIAAAAGVESLLLMHGRLALADECVKAAKEIFTGDVAYPKDFQTIELHN
jgi:ribonuclease Z